MTTTKQPPRTASDLSRAVADILGDADALAAALKRAKHGDAKLIKFACEKLYEAKEFLDGVQP